MKEELDVVRQIQSLTTKSWLNDGHFSMKWEVFSDVELQSCPSRRLAMLPNPTVIWDSFAPGKASFGPWRSLQTVMPTSVH